MNAAVWFGAALFFTLIVGPAFLSPDMLNLLGRPHAGAAAQVVAERFYHLQYWCGSIAVVHLLAEWLYASKLLSRVILFLLLGIFALGLMGGIWLQPRLQQLHLTMYGVRSLPEQREQAAKAFQTFQAFSRVTNVAITIGLLIYVWQLTSSGGANRLRR